MIDKIKNIFTNKEKRVENLISFLIILIVTLLIINRILKKEDVREYTNETDVEMAGPSNFNENLNQDNLEQKLEKILAKIDGVGKVSVLITYTESKSIMPVYNTNLNKSKTEENDEAGNKKTSETINEEKEVVKDESSNIITEKVILPQIEGALVIAQGANNPSIRSNIISAVETVTRSGYT